MTITQDCKFTFDHRIPGSERQARTHASGQRLKESGYINRSLSLLNNVITQLSQGSDFVPYRNSVLTWLLKESLGGNSKTVMIANISPAFEDLRETLSTLRYANRAKRIQNKPTINEDPKDLTIRCLMSEVKTLRKMVESLALRASFHPSVRLRSVGVQVPESPNETDLCLAIKLPQKRDSFAFREPSSASLALPFTPLFPNPFPKPHVLAIPDSQSEPAPKRRSSAIERVLSLGMTSQVVQKSATDTLIKKLTDVLKKPRMTSNSTKSANPESTQMSYPFFVPLLLSDDDTISEIVTGVKHVLQPGVTKIGSGSGADIHVPSLLEDHLLMEGHCNAMQSWSMAAS
ncbi:unnamed protein product [Closterium sp. Yama58-4]|nr:unnamed protein product [Closterium sp. Yama58-4]